MAKKINNSFTEEYKTPIQLANSKLKMLKIKKHNSNVNWMIFSGLILIANIVMIVLSSIALESVISQYNSSPKHIDFWSKVMPTAGVSIASLLIFFLTLIISVYRGVMKSHVYLEASERIQYLTMQYSEKQIKISEQDFKKEINKIYKTALKSKTKMSFKKTMITVLIGGDHE